MVIVFQNFGKFHFNPTLVRLKRVKEMKFIYYQEEFQSYLSSIKTGFTKLF